LVIRLASQEPREHIVHVSPHVQIVPVSTADQAHQSGTTLTASQAAALGVIA